DDHAADVLAPRAVGEHAPHEPTPVWCPELATPRGQLREHPASVVVEIAVQEVARDVADDAPRIRGAELEELLSRRGDAADAELRVEEHRGEVGALEEVQ